ncbi:MAG TPA: tetratricopeptide repeat protein [Steroidobacteraceae bacterium]|nr:tetratricopeptide repeat protein [Steroidobacteraceae bacterium]
MIEIDSECLFMRHADVIPWLVGFAVLFAGAQRGVAQSRYTPPVERTDKDLPECTPVNYSAHPFDYRHPDSTALSHAEFYNQWQQHYVPATDRMRRGDYSEPVMADLDFVMRHWPNHLPGLEALIQYGLAGGKSYEFDPVYCYLKRAHEFAPDDSGVLLHEGYYFWKTHDTVRAVEAYEAALAVDPNSADAHYNLGLLYCDTREYDKALIHARAAYDAGYPLPGLKQKLEKAGRWTETKPQ